MILLKQKTVMFKSIKKLFSTSSTVEDDFQVRIVTLKNGTKLYFPEHKDSWKGWQLIILVNSRTFTTLSTSIENDERYACLSLDEAKINVEGYRKVLQHEEGLKVHDESIAKLETF